MCKLKSAAIHPMFLLALALPAVSHSGTAQTPGRPPTPTAEIILNDTKMEAEIARSVSDVDRRVQAALDEMGLRITSPEATSDTRREYQAYNGDRIVQIGVERETARRTTIRVSSLRLFQGRRNGLEHDTGHARLVLERILQLN